MDWNLENLYVTGLYLGEIPVIGKVTLSRVKYGGGITHHVELAQTINVYGSYRDAVILEHHQIETVSSNI